MAHLPSPWDEYLTQVQGAPVLAALNELELKIFGRKAGALTLAMKDLGGKSPEEKKALGQLFNDVKRTLESAIADRRRALEGEKLGNLSTTDALDVTLDLPPRERGHHHPIHEYLRTVHEVFGRMGFDVAQGPEIETEENNFNMLNIPPDHPARDLQDTFWVSSVERTVLRTHTTCVQIRYMQSHKPPFRMVSTGKVYRKDSDATHSPMFHQIDGVMIGKDISLANMKAVMESAVRELVEQNVEFRWRTGFFPFVEPGLEMDLRWRGDESQSREGRWLEIVGCGMVHPNVLKNCGIDPAKWQGFAFGFGVERMLMIKHQIPDLRLFFQNDLRFLRQF